MQLIQGSQKTQQELVEMAKDPANKFHYFPDLKIPTDRIKIQGESIRLGFCMIATRDFKAGETVFANTSLIIPYDHTICLEHNCQRVWLDHLIHTVNVGDGKREFYGFDSFQNHSCTPNTFMRYEEDSEVNYELVAHRDITAGEELFSDYETFDTLGLDGTSFICQCQ